MKTLCSTSPSVQFSNEDTDELENKENVQSHNALIFPSSTFGLWNSTSLGDSIELKIPHEHPLTLLCLERCLRIAHRHASQTKHDNDRQSCQNDCFNGFLLGSTKYTDEEGSVIINLDRFDPGIIRAGVKSPSTPLPGDVVVPVIFTGEFSDESRVSNVFSVQDYENVFKLLHHQISSHLTLENTSLFPIRLICYCNKDGNSDEEIQLQMCLVTPYISNVMSATPIKQVPIIPTALAKNLSSPLNLSQVQNSSKSGYITMNQARKILLMLDSDPKSKSVQTVGIWVSGVVSVHHPVVWLSCMRYLYFRDVYERIMNKNLQFLLVLYSVTSPTPMFFQVTSDVSGKLKFGLLYAEKCSSICKQAIGNSERDIEFRFLPSALSTPNIMFKEQQIFQEALDGSPPFLAPRNLKKATTHERSDDDDDDDDEYEKNADRTIVNKNIVPNGLLSLKKPGMKPSILKKKTGDMKNKGIPNGVSFLSTSSLPDPGILPLPSPQPTPALQCPSIIRPTVPELSILFDEHYSIKDGPVSSHSSSSNQSSISTKKSWPSQDVRSPLRTLYTSKFPGGNSDIRGHSSFTADTVKQQQQYYQHDPATRNNPAGGLRYSGSSNRGPRCSVMPSRARRSHSASDVTRGRAVRNMAHQVPHPYNPHSSYSPMQNVPTIPTPHYYMTSNATYQQQAVPSVHNPQFHPAANYGPPASIPNLPYPVCYPQVNPRFSPQYYHTPHTTQSSARQGFPSRPDIQTATASTSLNPTVSAPNNIIATTIHPYMQGNPFPSERRFPEISTIPQDNTPDWMKQLPPEAYQLLMQQDTKLRELQAQIQKLLEIQTMQNAKVPTVTSSTSTDTADIAPEKHNMGVNTGNSIYIPSLNDSGKAEDQTGVKSTTSTTPSASSELSSKHSTNASEHQGNLEHPSDKSANSNLSSCFLKSSKPVDSVRSGSQCSNKGQSSEFASILLDDSNLLEIEKANVEEDNDIRSIASSLRAVDLPVLDTSEEQSSLNTPTRNLGVNTWDVQESPILGESASMCIVPPLNLEDGSSQEGTDNDPDTVRQTEERDGKFMQNLLSQVRVMLEKVDLDGTSDISSNLSESTAYSDNKKIKSKKPRSHEDRVAIATRKQLKKMGVVLDDKVVNALTTAVAKENRISSDDYPSTFPEPLIPRLKYDPVLTAACEYSTLLQGPSSTELSMHANAIALKYLSNNQLEEIASLSKLGKGVQYSNARASRTKDLGDTDPEIRSISGKSFTKMTGMSLVSPCNMSLATRKYMEKYGLIEGEEEDDDDEEEEDEATPTDEQTKLFNYNEMKHGFSDIKVNLGDTLDMISPFLNDLDLHKQKAPSSPNLNNTDSTFSGSSEHAKDKFRSRPNAGSRQEDHRNPESVLAPGKHRDPITRMNARNHRRLKASQDVSESQILSPKLLQVLAEGKKLSPTHSNREKSPYFHSYETIKNVQANQKKEEEFLSETWPRNQFQMRKPKHINSSDHPGNHIEESDLTSSCSAHNHNYRRQRPSPPSHFQSKLQKIRAIHDHPHSKVLENLREVMSNQGERGNVDEDQRILPFEVMNSSEGRDDNSNPNSRSSQDDVTHFLQHLQRECDNSR